MLLVPAAPIDLPRPARLVGLNRPVLSSTPSSWTDCGAPSLIPVIAVHVAGMPIALAPFRPLFPVALSHTLLEGVTMSSQLRGSSLSGQRRLKLETLESRCNPSTVIQEGDTLIIIGTQDADTVAIVDDGQGGIVVTFDNTASGGGKGDGSERQRFGQRFKRRSNRQRLERRR